LMIPCCAEGERLLIAAHDADAALDIVADAEWHADAAWCAYRVHLETHGGA